MRLFEGSVSDFNARVSNNQIADLLAHEFKKYYRRSPSDSEYRSWQQSSNYLKNSFDAATLAENRLILEYELPYSSRRLDALIFGADANRQDSVVLLELKQWSNENVTQAEAEGNVRVDFGRFTKEVAHPSLQVEGYHFDLKDFLKVFHDDPEPRLCSVAYCHNYARLKEPRVLFSPQFASSLDRYPVFAKEDARELGAYLSDRLAYGSGLEVFGRFITSPIRPSKRLLDHTGEMINHQQVFTLIDDQIAAYNAIMHRVKAIAQTDKKSVVIVKGGPGTGKSVIALEVMGGLLRQGKSVVHATGSSAFTKTLRQLVGSRAKGLFKFFNSFVQAEENAFDVLVADEAHRIRETSSTGWPRPVQSDVPQVDELIRVARLTVFFIDEKQIVRPNETGSVQLIRDAAAKVGIEQAEIPEFELLTQFRCSGSDAYLQWLDDVLGVRQAETPRFDQRMEFKIFTSPRAMMEEVRARNREKRNSARIVAGFCWPWSKPLHDGSLVKDVRIGDFEMPWERKDTFWKWATDDSGMEQVGTVYTAQGFEFDYIAVIFGNDLLYDPKKSEWKADSSASCDRQVTRGNAALTEHLKSVYRVLLSRAHKGVYVYFMDANTRRYFEARLKLDGLLSSTEESVARKVHPASMVLAGVSSDKQFRTHLPLYSLAAAASGFSVGQEVEPLGWIAASIGRPLTNDMFVVQVEGRSMEPTIISGSYCVFRLERGGSRNGRVVLVEGRHVEDPENGGRYTVKRYFSEKDHFDDGTWRHRSITLVPDNRAFKEIVLNDVSPAEFRVIGEFVAELRQSKQ
ncbi:MAG: DUF2075 domain-containing protein [Nitrospira sp.]|nr:DUF2075 domain-containing protein [Nitrospira sp.]